MAFPLVLRDRSSDDLTPRPRTVAAGSSLSLAGVTVVLGVSAAVLIIAALAPASAPPSVPVPLMEPLTAAGLMLCAISYLLVRRHRVTEHPGALRVARIAAALCVGLGAVSLAAYLYAAYATPSGFPGNGRWMQLPAPNGSAALLVLGCSLLGLSSSRGRRRRIARRGAGLVLVISLLALVGHAYGATVLYGLNRFGGMPISTALCVAVVALSILFCDLDRGIAAIFVSESSGGRLMRRLGPAALLVPPLLGWLRLTAESVGLADDAFGLAIFVVTLVVVFVWLLINQAAALHTFDIERSGLHSAERGARADAEAAQHAAERARREADQANQAKSVFLATMSHEIRTPINAIVGYGQLMELGVAGPVTPQQRDYLARLAATSEHLRSVVDDVLDLAKIDAGGMTVARDLALTGPLLAAALDLVRPQASDKGVKLVEAWTDDAGEPFFGDEHRVRQILANLLSNAIKFTEAGGTITIESRMVNSPPNASALTGSGPWAVVRVSDTGIGIPPDQQVTIFDPFHQVERGNTRKQGGTGLGLTISRRLARLMGGDLTVESHVGRGSHFTLWLPAAVSRPAADVGDTNGMSTTAATARVHGLAEVGMHLRERVEGVLASYAARCRADARLPNASRLRRSELEDHQLSFLSDIAQTLIVVEETGGADSDLLRDGSTIQRVVAELHGAMRQRRGWTEEHLEHEYAILDEEIAGVVRRSVNEATGDVSLALDVLHRLVERARVVGVGALRRSAEGEDGMTDEGAA